MKMKLAMILLFLAQLVVAQPLSREVSLKEVYSSSEIVLKASGMGEEGADAIKDLKKAALWFVLEGGTDPLLSSPKAKMRFETVAKSYYSDDKVQSYITWEAQKVTGQIKLELPNGEDGVKITKMLRLNKKKLEEDLMAEGVLVSKDVLEEAAGMPFIMVIPDSPKGQTPLDVFAKNKLAKHAAGVIESYLTAQKYNVVVPRALEQINQMNELQSQLKPAKEDLSYQLALSIGSDIYISYSGEVDKGKASVVVKAYETTTGRLLGTESGYSQTRPGAAMEPLVEEAINDAIHNVLQRVKNYWLDDLKIGSQYKVVFKVLGSYTPEQIEEIQFEIADLIEDVFAKSKEIALTESTADFVVWAKKDEVGSASKLYRFFKKNVKKANVSKISINKKLILLGLE